MEHSKVRGYEEASRLWQDNPPEELQHGGFALSHGPHQCDELALLDVKVPGTVEGRSANQVDR